MDAYDDEWVDSDFEGDAEVATTPIVYKPSYLLIAIDTDKSMFEDCKKTNGYSFSDALEACYDIFNSLVLAKQTAKGPVSIVLADNDATKIDFVDFEEQVPDTIKFLKNLRKQPIGELQFSYERKGNFDLADFFLSCKNKLLNIKSEVYKRTVIYITNDDDPVGNDAKRRFKVINESQKFASIEMELIVVTFKDDFNNNNFYSEVLAASNSPPVEKVDCSHLTEKLSSLVQKRTITKKCKFYPFPGNTESCVEVAVRKVVASSSVSKNMYVTRDTQQLCKKPVKQTSGDTYACIYSKDEPIIVLSEGERQKLSETNLPIGYTLFRVANPILKPGWIIKPPYLMQKHSKETRELFEMFWQFCRDKNKCLVCYQKLKKGGDVRFVELLPKSFNNVPQFLVKILPFGPENNYDSIKKDDGTFNREEGNVTADLVESLMFNYEIDIFQDPVESKKNAYIKSQLLEEDIEKIEDCVLSDDAIDDRLAVDISKLESLNLLEAPAAASTKRPRKTDYSRARKK